MVAVDDSLMERFTQTSGCQAEQEKHGKRGHLVSEVSVAREDNYGDFLIQFYTCRPKTGKDGGKRIILIFYRYNCFIIKIMF